MASNATPDSGGAGGPAKGRTSQADGDERRRRAVKYRDTVTRTRVVLFVVLLSACIVGRGVIGGDPLPLPSSSSSSSGPSPATSRPSSSHQPPPTTAAPPASPSASSTTARTASGAGGGPGQPNVRAGFNGHGHRAGGGGRPIGGSSGAAHLYSGMSKGGDGAGGGKESGGHDHPGYPIASVDFIRVETPFIIALWIFCGSLAKIGFHMTEYLSKIFPESCLLIVVGVVVGLLLFYTDATNDGTLLTPNVFLFYMLPPIILDAGYFMPNRLFFDHLGTILLMAVVGTIFNSMLIGGSLYLLGWAFEIYTMELPLLPALLFGALISAVDPVAVLNLFDELSVNEVLNIVVFGESLLNDAVTVVLYHMFEVYTEIGLENIQAGDIIKGLGSFFVISLGGTFIGVIWGFLTGFITRFTEHARVIEPVFVFVMSYLAYLNAEIFHLSGILATTFCGITMKNYVVANVSQKSQTTLKYTMKMLSSSSETIIFMLLGVSTVHDDHVWDTWFVVFTLIFCTVYRAVGVIILTAIANRFRLHKLEKVEKFVMAYGGLRGAVAFALVLLIDEKHVPQRDMFVTTTIAVIYFTVFVQGITIKPLVQILGVKRAEKRKKTMNERVHERLIDHMMAGIEELIGHTGNYYWREKFKYYDRKYIRPALLRERHVAEPKILDTFSKLKMRDAKSYAELNASASTADIQTMATMFKHVHPSSAFLSAESGNALVRGGSGWNLDMKELDYSPSARDLDDARINRLLDASMLRPYRRHNKAVRYNRHAVSDKEMPGMSHHKTYAHMRRFISEHAANHHLDRAKAAGGGGGNKQPQDDKLRLHPDSAVPGGDESDSGAAAASSRKTTTAGIYKEPSRGPVTSPPSSSSNGHPNGKGRGVTFAPYVRGNEKELSTDKIDQLLKKGAGGQRGNNGQQRGLSPSKFGDTDEDEDGAIFFSAGKKSGASAETSSASLTTTESTLPWKRPGGSEVGDKPEPAHHEYPAWLEMDQLHYSPSDSVLGMKEAEEKRRSAYDIFRRRESVGSAAGFHGSFRLHHHDAAARRRSRGNSINQSQPQPHHHHPHQHQQPQEQQRQEGAGSNLPPASAANAGPRDSVHPGIDNPAFHQEETVINIDGNPPDSLSDPGPLAPKNRDDEKKP